MFIQYTQGQPEPCPIHNNAGVIVEPLEDVFEAILLYDFDVQCV